MENSARLKYIKSFQGLRVLAAAMVFLAHAGFGAGLGSFAVVIFFLLSGFLAQMKYTEPQQKTGLAKECFRSLRKGYRKYFPLHALMLLAASVLLYKSFLNDPLPTVLRFLANLCLVQCWSPNRATNVSFNNLSWYLSSMMFCLLLSPLIVRFFSRGKPKRAFIAFVLIFAVQLGAAFALDGLSCLEYTGQTLEIGSYRASVAYWLVYIFPPARVLNFAMGCALFSMGTWLKSRTGALFDHLLLLFSLAAGAAVTFLSYGGREVFRVFDVAVWSLPACGIILSLSNEERLWKWIRFVFSNRAMQFLGGISFEFYMTHELVLRCARAGFRLIHVESGTLYVLSALAVSLGAAVLLHFCDRWFKKWKARRMEKTASRFSS